MATSADTKPTPAQRFGHASSKLKQLKPSQRITGQLVALHEVMGNQFSDEAFQAQLEYTRKLRLLVEAATAVRKWAEGVLPGIVWKPMEFDVAQMSVSTNSRWPTSEAATAAKDALYDARATRPRADGIRVFSNCHYTPSP